MRNYYHEIMKNQQGGESEPELCCWLDTSGKTWCPVLILPFPNAQLAFCFLQIEAGGDNPHEESETLAV